MYGVRHIQKRSTHLKKILIYISIYSLILGCICSCGFNPTGDWEYTDFPGKYEILGEKIGSNCLGHRKTSHGVFETIIDSYISSFCNNDRYIAVRWTDPKEVDFESISGYNFSNAGYYVVDTETDELFGMFKTESEFKEFCNDKKIVGLSEWIPTYPMPKGGNG